MALAQPATVIIACPQCGTRYQLDRAALGDGRVVQCASCQHEWMAYAPATPPPPPVPDVGFDEAAEDRLDATFAAEAAAADAAPATAGGEPSIADIRRAIAPRPKVDADAARKAEAALLHRHKTAFSLRQQTLQRQLPMARLRGALRVGTVVALVILLAGGLVWRKQVVEQFPDLAGVYAAIGLPVNVVGLEFADVRTLATLSEGALVLTVSGKVVQVSDRIVQVPAIVVTLLGGTGAAVYEWSVTPPTRDLEPGESVSFETRLTQPPQGAERVRLSFANARARPVAAASPPQPAMTTPDTGTPH
jgi:predicted Zn finger-like uncharacterized protein